LLPALPAQGTVDSCPGALTGVAGGRAPTGHGDARAPVTDCKAMAARAVIGAIGGSAKPWPEARRRETRMRSYRRLRLRDWKRGEAMAGHRAGVVIPGSTMHSRVPAWSQRQKRRQRVVRFPRNSGARFGGPRLPRANETRCSAQPSIDRLRRSLVRRCVVACAVPVDDDGGLVPDDPRVVPARQRGDVAGPGDHLGAVVHSDR
jgi:hypothetical protein